MNAIGVVCVFAAAGGLFAADAPDGKQIFAASCSVGYCHGIEGRAGRGPRLRDREWDRTYLFKVIDQGIPNSSMPAWHERLSTEQIHAVVNYILSISKEVKSEAAAAPAASGDHAASRPSAGKYIFFDSSSDRSCGTCHKVDGEGGDIGPDLSSFAGKPAAEILKAILSPGVSGKPQVEIVTRTGETVRGIVAEESPARLKLYDLTLPGPPVLRSFDRSSIQSQRAVKLGLHDKIRESYSQQQLDDIVKFLKH